MGKETDHHKVRQRTINTADQASNLEGTQSARDNVMKEPLDSGLIENLVFYALWIIAMAFVLF